MAKGKDTGRATGLSSSTRMRLALAAGCSEKTIGRAYGGARVHSTTRERLNAAARELGVALPPVPGVKR